MTANNLSAPMVSMFHKMMRKLITFKPSVPLKLPCDQSPSEDRRKLCSQGLGALKFTLVYIIVNELTLYWNI